MVKPDPALAHIDTASLQLIFQRIRRNIRKTELPEAIDRLRSKIKHLDPPVRLTDTWDDVKPRIKGSSEYKALETEQYRREALDKHLRRLKRRAEAEREENRHHRREHRDRDHRGHSRRTRSPEVDPYEAERRQAGRDRERHYRQSTNHDSAFTGRREGDRYAPDRSSRYRDYDTQYRRERESEDRFSGRADPRETATQLDYGDGTPTSRADPRERATTLDYGDSTPATRKRRDSDAHSTRSAKVCSTFILHVELRH